MRDLVLASALLLLAPPSTMAQQALVKYSVAFPAAESGVLRKARIVMTLPTNAPLTHAQFIIPRAIPMGYGRQMYDDFVSGVVAKSRMGVSSVVTRDQGPRWAITASGASESIATIEYDVDLVQMEAEVLAGGDSSRIRPDFISLLGYSLFGYVEGLENRTIELTIVPPSSYADWPVLSTLAPSAPGRNGPQTVRAPNFYGLADSQVWLGKGFTVTKLKGSPDLFLAVHSEGPHDADVMAPLAEQAYDAMTRYFGSTPFSHFTLMFDYLKPLSPRHTYGFSMEHMESATFGALADTALTASSTDREKTPWRYNVAHHLAHAWTPKRAYGEGYFPFRWELAPLIDSIWFAEGFGQFAAADALSDLVPPSADGQSYRDRLVEFRFRDALKTMPTFLKEMPLIELSRVASTVYSEDFRTGRTVFARGGLMAYEMDQKIRAETRGSKGLRDGLRALMAWSAREKRGFRIDELPAIFKAGTGVDTRDILDRWLAPLR
ncbi:MAG: hypothetical protein ABI672_02935 [Vicinamibacteria bacterium]